MSGMLQGIEDNSGPGIVQASTGYSLHLLGDRLCWKCDSVVPSHVSFIEHFSYSHVTGPTSLTSLVSDLASNSELDTSILHSMKSFVFTYSHQ